MTAIVYFDSKEFGRNKLLVNCTIYEDKFLILNENLVLDKKDGENFYHNALKAMTFALELAEEEDFEQVEIRTQFDLVLKWLLNKDYKGDYLKLLNPIKDIMKDMISNDVEINYLKIKGKENLAKKNLEREFKNNKLKYQQDEVNKLAGSFNDLFK